MSRSSKKRRVQSVNDESTVSLVVNQNEVDSFFETMRTLYEEGRLCDVCFRVENRSFHAHRVVLASANSFLGSMIQSGMQESQQNVIHLQAEANLFKFILDYIYGVRIDVPSSEIVPLLCLASSYCMTGLRDKLGDLLGSNLTVANCCSTFAAAGLVYNCQINFSCIV